MGRRAVASVGTAEYDALVQVVKAARKETGVTQRELSERLGRSHNYVLYIERGSRRLDVVEFVAIAKALGKDPGQLLALFLEAAG